MHIGYKSRPSQRPWPQPVQGSNVKPLEHRIHGHAFASPQALRRPHGPSVDEDQIDFGMGYAEGFNDVLDCRRTRESVREAALAP